MAHFENQTWNDTPDCQSPSDTVIVARTPNLYAAIGAAERAGGVNVARPNERQQLEIIEALMGVEGINATDTLDDMTVKQGIIDAQELVDKQEASTLLRSLQFMDNHDLPVSSREPVRVFMGGAISIDARHIVGTDGFASWNGRAPEPGRDVTTSYKQEQGVVGPARPGTAVIQDYATRPTKLPNNTEAVLYLTDNGMFAFTRDAHRTAAAQLRREPVAVECLTMYDFRGDQISDTAQRSVDAALKVVAHNTQI